MSRAANWRRLQTRSMWTDAVRLVSDVSAARWIGPRLTGAFGTVLGTVPSGFEAYARVLHPVSVGWEQESTWADVAKVTGRRVHPAVQWHSLIGAAGPFAHLSDRWDAGEPEQGNLTLNTLQALCAVLSQHTSTPNECFFAMWEGWGQLHGGHARVWLTSGGRGVPAAPLLSPDELDVERVRLPHRNYLLMSGPLTAVSDLARYDGPGTWVSQSPSLIWPADGSWCLATEIDFDSTLVGGPTPAIDKILSSPNLEAMPVDGTLSLRADADHLN